LARGAGGSQVLHPGKKGWQIFTHIFYWQEGQVEGFKSYIHVKRAGRYSNKYMIRSSGRAAGTVSWILKTDSNRYMI
jgi:hypothetical protein